MSCGIECRFSRFCHFRSIKPAGDDPENCPEYWKLEEIESDVRWDREYEDEDDSCGDYEDDFTEDDLP